MLVRLPLAILVCAIPWMAKADIIYNSGSCTVIVQGNNNQTSFSGDCKSIRELVSKAQAEDNQRNVCWTNNNSPWSSFCSTYIAGHRTSYGYTSPDPFEFSGRYLGEMSSDKPHGRGQFLVRDVRLGPLDITVGVVNSDENPPLALALGQGRRLLLDGDWVNGDFTGNGRIVMPDGSVLQGKMQNAVVIQGQATNISSRALGLESAPFSGRYTGSISNGEVTGTGQLVEITTDKKTHEQYNLTTKGIFSDGKLIDGTSTLIDSFGVVWVETLKAGNPKTTYSRK